MFGKIWRFLTQLIQRVFRTSLQHFNPPLRPLAKGGEQEGANLSSPLSKGGQRGVPHNLGDFEGAIASLDKALEIKPDYHVAWYSGGVTLGNLGRVEDARSSVECDRPNRDWQKMALK